MVKYKINIINKGKNNKLIFSTIITLLGKDIMKKNQGIGVGLAPDL
jgi:hypothetical protein